MKEKTILIKFILRWNSNAESAPKLFEILIYLYFTNGLFPESHFGDILCWNIKFCSRIFFPLPTTNQYIVQVAG